jgi:hypothetical protein
MVELAYLRSMRRATVTISDEIESSLDAYIHRQEAAPCCRL